MSKFSICALTYGDHLDLAKRCLESLTKPDDYKDYVADFRVGLNSCAQSTKDYVFAWAKEQSGDGVPVFVVESPDCYLKYVMMRKMFEAATLSKLTMWFDDDSYVDSDNFYKQAYLASKDYDLVGQLWKKKYPGNMYNWIRTLSWANKLSTPPAHCKFFTGGWWIMDSKLIQKYDWPQRELRHKGGDMLLGELARHKNFKTNSFDNGVRINADAAGTHSAAPRRGYSAGTAEVEVGTTWKKGKLPTSHNDDYSFSTTYHYPAEP